MAVVDELDNLGKLILIGTTNLRFDAKRGRWEDAWPTLAGTVRNCAGGVTPWGTWITGEETLRDYRQNEWAGACYSPDGKWLFANIQTPGITFAITGPWGGRPL
jgi:secreted PhoX family phosphatase